MTTRRIHYLSGVVISIFVGFHLMNHAYSVFGPERHIELMTSLRLLYRNILVEVILMLAVAVQIISGLSLFAISRKSATSNFDRLHIWSGLYLAIFLVIHVSAVFAGRYFLNLDTNFYFGVAGLNTFPTNLFFVPYYALAILSFFGHVASIHNKKANEVIMGLKVDSQAKAILILGMLVTLLIFWGLTNHLQGVEIPEEYKVLIGR
jgi:hypothetical protein